MSNDSLSMDTDSEVTIGCRSCNNQMPVDANRCPHCGSRIISRYESAGIAIGGFLLAVATAVVGLWPFTVIGGLALIAGFALYRNRTQKIRAATE